MKLLHNCHSLWHLDIVSLFSKQIADSCFLVKGFYMLMAKVDLYHEFESCQLWVLNLGMLATKTCIHVSDSFKYMCI